MGNNFKVMKVRKDTYDLIEQAKTKFLKNNKKFAGMNITYNFIIRKVLEEYLKEYDF